MEFTKATIALHNFLRTQESSVYCPTGFIDAEDGTGNVIEGKWREERSDGLMPLRQVGGNRLARTIIVTNNYKLHYDYMYSPSGTPGQLLMSGMHLRNTSSALLVK